MYSKCMVKKNSIFLIYLLITFEEIYIYYIYICFKFCHLSRLFPRPSGDGCLEDEEPQVNVIIWLISSTRFERCQVCIICSVLDMEKKRDSSLWLCSFYVFFFPENKKKD
jgi:hypothetical protein